MIRNRFNTAVFIFVMALGCAPTVEDHAIPLAKIRDMSGVEGVERLVDNQRAPEGAPWDSRSAAFFRGDGASVIYDLGAVTPIEAAYIQGDNNDRFIIEGSENGTEFTPLWVAPAVDGAGQRSRWKSGLGGRARFVRLRAIGGDAFVSATELELFSAKPTVWPPRVPAKLEAWPSLWARLFLVAFAIIASGAALRHRRGSRASAAWWAATGLSAVAVPWLVVIAWPPEPSVINLARAVCAAVACAVVYRLGARAATANRRLLTALLAAMALASVATFYNFGRPQFYDVSARRPSYVHTWDLRVYFPAAKYFDELGYDGVYLASVKAYAEDELGGSLERIKQTPLRDLRTYEMKTVAEAASEIDAVKDRFSAERWREFKKDMSYFWRAMGTRGYLDSLRDHGANATPAWLWLARLLCGDRSASDGTFLLGAAIDPLLLALFFVVAWRTFGLRAALVCIVVFGATSIYQFGTNWGGATLRNDWMVLLGLGVCALKAARPFLGGVLLGWSAMIRAFPALALIFLVLPIGWQVFSGWRRRRRNGELETVSGHPPRVRALAKAYLGAAAAAVLLVSASAGTFGLEKSWGVWSDKIELHATKPNFNHLGIIALVGFDPDNLSHRLKARGQNPDQWGPLTAQTVEERRWMIVLAMLFFTWLAVLACRDARLSDAAVIGTMMIPVYFYPANYYLHVIFLWPLLLAAWRGPEGDMDWTWISVAVLGCCVVQWFGWLLPDRYGQFLFWSGTLLALIVAVLVIASTSTRRRGSAWRCSSASPNPSPTGAPA